MDGLSLISAAQDAGLTLSVDGEKLVIRGPKSKAELVQLLLSRKPDIIAALKPRGSQSGLPAMVPFSLPTDGKKPIHCPRCKGLNYIDVPIHAGQSIRRDCARCNHLIDFPLWYGKSS